MTDDGIDYSEDTSPTKAELVATREIMQFATAAPALLIEVVGGRSMQGRQWRQITEMLHLIMLRTVRADDDTIAEFTPSKMVVTPHRSTASPSDTLCIRCLLPVEDQVHAHDDPEPSVVWGPP